MDPFFLKGDDDKGIDGERVGLILYDLFTGMMDCYPTGSKNTNTIIPVVVKCAAMPGGSIFTWLQPNIAAIL